MSETIRELDALLTLAMDGELSPADMARLATMLREDDAALQRYLTMMEADALLEEELTPESAELVDPLAASASAPLPMPRPARSVAAWAMAAAVLIGAAVIGVIAMTFSGTANETTARPVVAVMLEERGAIWNAGEPIGSGGDVTDAWRSLAKGRIEMQTRAGVNVKVVGPARFAAVSPMVTRLDAGRMLARVPKGAEGYTVRVPGGLEIVDLGTEFAVEAADDGRAYVQVFEGLVALRLDGVVRTIHAGESIAFEPDTRELTTIEPQGERFARLRAYELELINSDFASGDLAGWAAFEASTERPLDSVIVPTGPKSAAIDTPPAGTTDGRAVRLGFKYQPVSLRTETGHLVEPGAGYTIAVRARAADIDTEGPYAQGFQLIANVAGRNIVTRDVNATGEWRWLVLRVAPETLEGLTDQPLEIRIYKPRNKEGDFVWIDAVQLWRGDATEDQFNTEEKTIPE